MAIRKISILNNGQWQEAQPIGADANDIVLTHVANQSLGQNENLASAIVSASDVGTSAWNKYNKLCNAVIGLESSLVTTINTSMAAAAATMAQIQTNANSAISNITPTVNNAIASASTALNTTFAPVQTNITLPTGSTIWIFDNVEQVYSQTITNNIFNPGDYVYWVSPTTLNYAGIYMGSVGSAQATFKALTIPENNVIMNIVRMKQGSFASS